MTAAPPPEAADAEDGAAAVLRNRPFLLLWLAQASTQIGGNMVLYGLTVIIAKATDSNSAVSALILTFLVPAVLFSAVAGVYVDRLDRRLVLVVTNVLRFVAFLLIFFAGDHLLAILLLNIFVSTVTVFFAPAEAAMIPYLVPRQQLLAANGIFTVTLNAAFALGFALFGPLVVTLAGAPTLILFVAVLYLVAAAFCWTLPPSPPVSVDVHVSAGQAVADAERAVENTIAQLREGLDFIRSHRNVSWSLVYLGIAASLVGVLGVLGPNFAEQTLGLAEKDFVVVVLPLGVGIVMGILLLNSYGKYLPRRRVIEGGLIALGLLLASLSIAGPISQFLRRAQEQAPIGGDLSAVTSLLAIVVAIAFLAGISYALVAIPAQTQLQEDIPEDVRGRVFGVLNMLVSVASFLPIIVVGPIADLFGTGAVLLVVAIFIASAGVASVVQRGPLRTAETRAGGMVAGAGVDPMAIVSHVQPSTGPTLWSFDEDDPEGPDPTVAPWMRAAGWVKRKPPPEPDPIDDPGAQPPQFAASDPAATDRLGISPDDPEPDDPDALARAQTIEMELPSQAREGTEPDEKGTTGRGEGREGTPRTGPDG